MSGEDCGEDRLSKNEFAELIQHLPVQEMFLIEYSTGKVWRSLFSRKAQLTNQFYCHLCSADVSCFKNLLAHIQGRRHVTQMRTVVSLYHPEYTYPKGKEPDAPVGNADDTNNVSNENETDPTNVGAKLPPTQTVEKKEEKKSPPADKASDKKEDKLPGADKVAEKKEVKKFPPADKNQQKKVESKAFQACKPTVKNPPRTDKAVQKNIEQKVTQTAKVIESNIPKKVPDKVPATKNGSSNKKTDIVVNPIATPSSVTKKPIEDKPVYQTDKIIIPTSVKNKTSKEAPKKSPTKDSPMFSTKSYSSKPADDEVYGILGVEYVIKLLSKNKESSPRYECGLCELVLDAYAMQRHLEGYNHRLKFCEKHFPTAIRHYRQYMQGISEHDMFKVLTPVLAKLAVAIEKHHGRNLPYECYDNDFALHRHDILAKAFSCRHASEQYGPTFTHVVDSKEIDKFINERHLYAPPTASRSAIFDKKSGMVSDMGSSQLNGNSLSKTSVPKDRHMHVIRENNQTLVGSSKKISKSNSLVDHSNFMTASPMVNTFMDNTNLMAPNNFSQQNMMEPPYMSNTLDNHFNPNNFPSNNFPSGNFTPSNSMMNCFMTNPAQDFSMHTPPTMPNYPSYNNRTHSVDDQTYNKMVDEFLRGTMKGMPAGATRKRSPPTSQTFPPPKKANIEGWPPQQSRAESSAEEEIAKLDVRFRKYRQDPEKYPQYNDEWQKFWKNRKDELIAAGQNHRSYNYQPEWVKFIKTRIEVLYREELEKIKSKSAMIHAHSLSSSMTTGTSGASKQPKTETEHTQVVSVLRLMAALEENLGSLGPKIIALLSKALQLEKTHRGAVGSHLLDDENCSVIETAKEKFKGLLLAGIVAGSKQRAMQKAVEEAESLLNSTQEQQRQSYMQKQQRTNIAENPTKPQQSGPSISDILRLLRAHSNQK